MASIRVLLVDDEQEFLTILERRLKTREVDIRTAANGLDGLKLLDEHRMDVVVLDVRMPGVGGMETLRKIKQRHPLVEVIMLTGHGSVESAVEGLKLGAFDYLVKPIDFSLLVTKLNEAYVKKEAVEEKIRKAKTEQIIRHPLAVFNEEE